MNTDLHFAKPDYDRLRRRGMPEVIYGAGKTAEQIAAIMRALNEANQNAFATRVTPEQAETVGNALPAAVYHAAARILTCDVTPLPDPKGKVAILCAGTSDLPVAEEAAITADLLGCTVERIYDVGVAGLHRLLAQMDRLQAAGVVVVVAGMEGALASVIGGLVQCPVVAVPTSAGYGASFGGLAALLAMLNSCAAGVAVCNIDNGFGAAWMANRILRVNE